MKKRAQPLKANGIDLLRSALIWVLSALWFVPMALLMTLLAHVIHPSRTEWLSRLFCRVQLYLIGARLEVSVHPAVLQERACLFVQNHTNHFDFIIAYNATPQFKQGIELAAHFRYPVYGWLMKARGTIPVGPMRRNQLDDLRERMRIEVAAGHSLLAFPEATRTLNGHVARFRKGVFRVARDLALPVVPIAVTGTWHLMRKGSLLLKPGRSIRIHVGEPMATGGLDDQQLDGLIQNARSFIAAMVDHQDDQDSLGS